MRRGSATATAEAMTEAELEAAGYTSFLGGHFSARIGKIWRRGEPGEREIAFLTDQSVANDMGRNVHGGALMTMADLGLGIAAHDAVGHPHMVTAQLQYHFAGGVPVGSLVICRPELVRRTRRMAFIRGLFSVDGQVVGSADAIYAVLDSANG
jgi:acyl-coenzyme A thioesterase PaaI-like protein